MMGRFENYVKNISHHITNGLDFQAKQRLTSGMYELEKKDNMVY